MAHDIDPSLAALLDVQAADNLIEVLHHRLAALPERAELATRQAAISALDARAAELAPPRHDIERRQKRLEDEVSTLRAKADDDEASLYSGRVSALKDLQALQHEITSLRRRAGDLEDQILDLMVELEPLAEEEATFVARRDELEAAARSATVALAEAQAVVDRELAEVRERRGEAVAATTPDALAQYQRLRPAYGGSAVVRLVGTRCEGCPLAMPAMEVDRIRRSTPGMATCDECGRLVLH